MEIEANITRFDLLKMQIHLLFNSKESLYNFLICFFIVGAFAWKRVEETGLVFMLVVAFLTSLFIYFVFVGLNCAFQLVFSNKKNGFIGNQSFRLTDWGFEERNRGTETKTSWANVGRIYKAKNALYLQITGYRLHIIPRSSFASCEEFLDFTSKIEKLKARSNT